MSFKIHGYFQNNILTKVLTNSFALKNFVELSNRGLLRSNLGLSTFFRARHSLFISFIVMFPQSSQTTLSLKTDRSTHHLRNTRNINILFTPSVRSDFLSLIACHIVWNSLPVGSRMSLVRYFQKNFKKFLMSWCLCL